MMRVNNKIESGGMGNDDTDIEGSRRLVNTFKEHVPPTSFKKILNPGAGAGGETRALIDAGYEVTGLSFGVDNLRLGKEKYNVVLFQADMHDVPFESGCFDGIFATQTFEHALSPWMLVIEWRRLLRDGGRVFVDVPSPSEGSMETIWHTNVLYTDQIRSFFMKSGFKEVETGLPDYKHIFEKIPDGEFEKWGYVRFIIEAFG